jgi:hypothetical protein
MSIPLKVGNVIYNFPQVTDEGWGPDVTNWALAITQNTLQKTGGLFALTAPLDFGPNYGIKSIYYSSRSGNPAQTGQVRLANNESINFRNYGTNGTDGTLDLAFGPGSSDAIPQWNGIDLVNLSTTQSLSNKTLLAPIIDNPTFSGLPTLVGVTITNAIINTSTVPNSLGFGAAQFDALVTTTLLDNQSVAVSAFSFVLPGNENIVVEYSINRNGNKEIGQMFITTDGITAQVAPGSLNLVTTGIIFTADVNAGTIRLLYTSTSTGFPAIMKYITRRWAD